MVKAIDIPAADKLIAELHALVSEIADILDNYSINTMREL